MPPVIPPTVWLHLHDMRTHWSKSARNYLLLVLILLLGLLSTPVLAGEDDLVAAWGWGDAFYRLGTPLSDLTNVKAVAAGTAHSLVLLDDGTVIAGGCRTRIINGVPMFDYHQCTVPSDLNNVTAIAAGGWHSLALKADGTVVAWGDDTVGQISVPSGLHDVIAIEAGIGDKLNGFSLALKGDGTVVAWGDNTYGQTSVPNGLTGVIAISAGARHSLALKNDGTVVAWGDNTAGQSTIPGGLTGVTAISAGGSHSLALKSDGTVVAWGSNSDGQSSVPPGLTGIVAISAGGSHSLALKSNGTLAAWGLSNVGQGFGSLTMRSLNGVKAIDAGGMHNLAIFVDPTPPTVLSITRASANPTNSGTVAFTVTFNEWVTSVDINAFVLTTSGSVTGASIVSVASEDNLTGFHIFEGTIFTVVVNTGSGNGTLRLDLIDNDVIYDQVGKRLGGEGVGNGNFTSGEVYTIIKDGTSPPINTPTPMPTPTHTATGTPTHTAMSPTPTQTATVPPTPTNTPMHTPTVAPTNTSVPPPSTSTPPSGADTDQIGLSTRRNGSVSGLSFRDEDIIQYDRSSGAWQMIFDGSDVGLSGVDVDAFAFQGSLLLLSVDADFTLAAQYMANQQPLAVDDADILVFVPTRLGTSTQGYFQATPYLDGSAHGLDTDGEDIDAMGFDAQGNLLVSVTGAFNAAGIKGNDEDLFALSNGNWSLYFDGSKIGLTNSSEDIAGLWSDPSHQKLYMTTVGNFSVGNIGGSGEEVFVCTYSGLGAATACSLNLDFDGQAVGLEGYGIDGLLIGAVPLVVSAQVDAAAVVDQAPPADEIVGDDVDDLDELDGNEIVETEIFLPLITHQITSMQLQERSSR